MISLLVKSFKVEVLLLIWLVSILTLKGTPRDQLLKWLLAGGD